MRGLLVLQADTDCIVFGRCVVWCHETVYIDATCCERHSVARMDRGIGDLGVVARLLGALEWVFNAIAQHGRAKLGV